MILDPPRLCIGEIRSWSFLQLHLPWGPAQLRAASKGNTSRFTVGVYLERFSRQQGLSSGLGLEFYCLSTASPDGQKYDTQSLPIPLGASHNST